MNTHAKANLAPSARGRGTRRAPGFSIAEMMIALGISSALLAATLVALDTSYKGYKTTSEAVSTHVITRIALTRMTSLIRTGEDFTPYPVNAITNPVNTYNAITFRSETLPNGDEIYTTLERRTAAAGNNGPFELWYVQRTFRAGVEQDSNQAPLLSGVLDISFTCEHDVGPRLRKVTIDLAVIPDDVEDAAAAADIENPVIRMIATAAPRRIDD